MSGRPFAELEKAGCFSPLDVELAAALGRIVGERDERVLLAAALASREVQRGHVCVELSRFAAQPMLEGAPADSAQVFPAREAWLEALVRSELVSRDAASTDARPLVLDTHGRLYLARYYDHERQVALRLDELARAEPSVPPIDNSLVDRLFPPRAGSTLDLQREAALASRTRQLSVIVGGPGTGKTSTVVKLLALLLRDARASGRSLRTLMVAPTGKAAQRLSEAVERARAALPVDEALRAAIDSRALTVHRALGSIDGSTTRFRHHRERPLACDLLLLDEASMVDLALLRRLLDAVPAHARVILLGDPDQLVSVEAGGVLADLCRAARGDQAAPGPIARCLSELRQSYRYPEGSGIEALARAVHAQDAGAALAVLKAGLPDVVFAPVLPASGAGRGLEREARERYAGLLERDLETRLAALEHFRVLCAHRKGPRSVEQLNPALARALSGRPRKPSESYAGRPILITQNDYATELFNGDVGVLHADRPRSELSARFRVGPDKVRAIALARLPNHESVYAMTVHKSQGSEFDQVAIVLPELPSPILSRELLYTAITRAKRGVSIYASEASLRAAIGRRTERSSGLHDRLRRRA